MALFGTVSSLTNVKDCETRQETIEQAHCAARGTTKPQHEKNDNNNEWGLELHVTVPGCGTYYVPPACVPYRALLFFFFFLFFLAKKY